MGKDIFSHRDALQDILSYDNGYTPRALEQLSQECEQLRHEISALKTACRGWATAWRSSNEELQRRDNQMTSLLHEITELRASLDIQASPPKHYATPMKLDMALAKDRQIKLLRKKVLRKESSTYSSSVYSEDDGDASPPFEGESPSSLNIDGGVPLSVGESRTHLANPASG